MPAILWRPSCRSRKKVNSSGSFREIEFAADRFFNLFAFAAVVIRQFVRRLAGFESFSDYVSADAGTGDYSFAERNKRIDDNVLWLVGFIYSRERIKAQ